MSSATRTDVAQSRGIVKNLPKMTNTNTYGERGGGGPTDSMNERQIQLDWYWRFYRCMNYDARTYDWNGQQITSKIETDIIGTSGVIPAGFYDAGQTLPLKFRRPSVQVYLCKVIVARFTSLLFSKKRHPEISCTDPDTQDWLTGFVEKTRLWSHAIQMRNYGGAQGSVAIGFKFVDGVPSFENHDARWCTPEFSDRASLTVEKFEKRYQFPEDVRNPEGEWEQKWFWYRRIITDTNDTVWPKVSVEAEDGSVQEPDWDAEENTEVEHNFGECPIIWIQNNPLEDATDGDPDCYGTYDIITEIDTLLSQASRGTIANSDPTIGISSDADFDEIKKGSGNALQVEKGGRVEYLEMSGNGIERAMLLADQLEDKVLTISRCVLDRKDSGQHQRTATEIERTYAQMLEQADIHREQYGERGIKLLLEMVLRIARKMDVPTWEDQSDGTTKIVRTQIKLPQRRVKNSDEDNPRYEDRVLGNAEEFDLKWPTYFTPSLDDIQKAVGAATQAWQAGILDLQNVVEFIANYMGVEDVATVLERLEKAREKADPGSDIDNLLNNLTQSVPPAPPQELRTKKNGLEDRPQK